MYFCRQYHMRHTGPQLCFSSDRRRTWEVPATLEKPPTLMRIEPVITAIRKENPWLPFQTLYCILWISPMQWPIALDPLSVSAIERNEAIVDFLLQLGVEPTKLETNLSSLLRVQVPCHQATRILPLSQYWGRIRTKKRSITKSESTVNAISVINQSTYYISSCKIFL